MHYFWYKIGILLLWGGLFVISSCSKLCDKEYDDKKLASLFVSVPITKFSPINCPCLDIELEGVNYSVELDLGFRGYVTMNQDVVDQIISKKEVGHRVMYGMRGKEYLNTLYEIPKVKVGNATFFEIGLQGEGQEFIVDGVFRKNNEEIAPRDLGRIGWCLFRKSNLLIDVSQKNIIFCDSMENLQKHGYFLQNWIEVPMLLEQGMVEFHAMTPQGPLRCMLDTGCTLNMLHFATDQTIDEAIWDPKNVVIYPWFKIGDQDVGETRFYSAPIQLPISVESILGMEFFSKHLVFLDFARGKIVFAKNDK